MIKNILYVVWAILGCIGNGFAIVGIVKAARGTDPNGIILIVIGAVILGFTGISVPILAKLLGIQ